MAKSHNQKTKILVLEQMLRGTGEDHVVTMQDILGELQERGIAAERKSIYDDMEALRDFGLEVRFKRGRPGGYYLLHEQNGQAAQDKPYEPGRRTAKLQETVPKADTVFHAKAAPDQKPLRLIAEAEMENDLKSFFGPSIEIKKQEDSRIILTVSQELSPVFFGWLTSMGTKVRILKPKKAVQAYREYLKIIVKDYKSPES